MQRNTWMQRIKSSPSENSSEKRRVETLGWRQATLHFCHRNFVFRGAGEETEPAGNGAEHVRRGAHVHLAAVLLDVGDGEV